jgi:gliding motility-associated-like protein
LSSDGLAPFTYGGDATTGLVAGTYTYTVTDANGCTATTTATINAAPAAITLTATPTQIVCFGGLGSVVLSSDGLAPFTYGGDATTGLVAGTYTYTVTDANGCTATTTATINAAPAAITLAATPTQIVCFGGLGSVVLSSDGLAPFTYGGDATTGLVAGTYTYTVTDANGCTATVAVTITEPAAPDAGTNGALSICPLATVTATQLFAALSGSPDGGGTWSPALAGAGTYTYTVTAIAPCTIAATAAIVVTESGVPDAGTDGALTICVGSTVTAAQLFGQLGGSPDGGGTWSPTLAGAGTYSYTVTTPAPCANIATTDVVVTEQVAPNAGTNGTLSICPLTTVTAAQLFGALNGTPDISGTWSPALTGAGTYTYTVTAIAPCTVAATAAIVVTESGVPDAGTNGALSICPLTTVTAAQLFGALNGTPDISGIWSPALAGGGTYTYTVTTLAPCANVATTDVVVTEQVAPDAGTDGALTICVGSTVTAAQLFGQLGGSPDGGGTWSPTLAGAGTYSYTVTTPAPCANIATTDVVVTEQVAPNAGTNGTLSICPLTTVTAAQLFGALNGTPDISGTWSPALTGAGTYTYTVTAIAPCTVAATAAIVVTESGVPDAGTNGALSICPLTTVTAAQLFGALNGTPDISGIWSPALAGGGTYTYTVTTLAPCANVATTDVVVTEQVAPDAGTDGALTICAGSTVTAAQLFGQLGGSPDGSGTWSPTLAGAGTYSYTVTTPAPCTVAAKAIIVVTVSNITPSFDANSFAFTAYETYVVNDEIKFYNLSTGAAIAVLWDFGDGSTSSEFEPSLTYTEIGTYTVTLTITDQFGCIYSYYEDIEITKGYDIIVPNQFTPNGDGINDNFRPVYFGIVTTLMEVYDTWGGMVYWEEGNILEGWNGLIKNKEAENGNYFYRIIAQPFNTSSPIKLSGSFNLSK